MANISQENIKWCFHLQNDSNKLDYFHITFIACCVVNAIFAVFATICNGAIVIGIKRTPSLHTPSNLLFCGLAASGLGVGILTQPTYVIYKVAELTRTIKTICWIRQLHHICTHFFSKLLLFILAEISVERFLGVYLLQIYRIVVSGKRVAIALVAANIAAAFIAASTAIWKYSIASNALHFVVMFCTVLITIASYSIIYHKLKERKQIRRSTLLLKHSKSNNNEHICIYKHSIKTVAWLIGSVVVCSLPQLCLLVVQSILGYSDPVRLAQNVAATILFMNATFNPLIWFYRNKDIRQAAYKALGICGTTTEIVQLQVLDSRVSKMENQKSIYRAKDDI